MIVQQWPTKALVPGASLEKAPKKSDSSHIYEENAKLRLFSLGCHFIGQIGKIIYHCFKQHNQLKSLLGESFLCLTLFYFFAELFRSPHIG